jgi:ribosomal protein S18 acetylase RimI-like enzyme
MNLEKLGHASILCDADAAEIASRKPPMEVRRYDTKLGTVTLRAERAEDEPFLFALFRSHTERPLKQAGLAHAAIDTMVAFQHRSQSGTHRAMFPNAVYSIIESDAVPIGRLIEEDEGERVYFVDFALLPERQAKGLGTAFIEQVANEWAAKGRAARVEVHVGNEPSLKLCRKLGFVTIEDKRTGYVNLLRPRELAPGGTGV